MIHLVAPELPTSTDDGTAVRTPSSNGSTRGNNRQEDENDLDPKTISTKTARSRNTSKTVPPPRHPHCKEGTTPSPVQFSPSDSVPAVAVDNTNPTHRTKPLLMQNVNARHSTPPQSPLLSPSRTSTSASTKRSKWWQSSWPFFHFRKPKTKSPVKQVTKIKPPAIGLDEAAELERLTKKTRLSMSAATIFNTIPSPQAPQLTGTQSVRIDPKQPIGISWAIKQSAFVAPLVPPGPENVTTTTAPQLPGRIPRAISPDVSTTMFGVQGDEDDRASVPTVAH